MLYNFYLDGNPVENPKGWDEMITVIRRDRDLKGQFITMDVTFIFTSTGYTYLKNKSETDGYCSEILLKIEQSVDEGNTFINFYDGIIKISKVEFMTRQPGLEQDVIVEQYAKTPVQDNSFFSKILTNKSIKTSLMGAQSKNGVVISATPMNFYSMFDPVTGTDYALVQERGAIKVFDAFQYLISFMTDGSVAFESDYFDTGDGSGDYLTFGKSVRLTGAASTMTLTDFLNSIPGLSFAQLYQEENKKRNLGIFITIDSAGQPTAHIEKWEDLRKSDTVSATISNIDRIITKISENDIYAKVDIGSSKTFEVGEFPQGVKYIGFGEETWVVVNECNEDTVLDLKTETFATDSNYIQNILDIGFSGGTDLSYDKDWILLNGLFAGGQFDPSKTNWINSTSPQVAPFYYNEQLQNANILNRYTGAVPNDLADYLGGGVQSQFEAQLTTTDPVGAFYSTTPFFPVKFNTEISDPLGVYNPVTFEFTAPANGAYSFYAFLNLWLRSVSTGLYTMRMTLRRYDSIGNLIFEHLLDTRQRQIEIGFLFPQTMEGAKTIYMDGTDTAEIGFSWVGTNLEYQFPGNPVTPNHGSSQFMCTGSSDGGGVFQTYDPAAYPIILDSFEQELSKTVFDQIAASPLSLIEFSQGDQIYKKGWIDELRYDHNKGIGKFVMLSAKNTN